MDANDRQTVILERLEVHGASTYQELTELLGVSNMTVRRDVDKLAAQGKAVKTLRGAQLAGAPADLYESRLRSRLSLHRPEKRAIAAAALSYVRPGETVFLDGSTTCLELAKRIGRERARVTVITNSILAAREAGSGRDNTVLMTGGQYDPASCSCVGSVCEAQLRQYFAARAFLSTKGFIVSDGTFESSLDLLQIKRLVAAQSTQLILLLDSSKFGRRALCKVLDTSQIHLVITDENAPRRAVASLKRRRVKTEIASLQNPAHTSAKAKTNATDAR